MEEANERLKYRKRVEECQRKGWKAGWEPIEVGVRFTSLLATQEL